VEKGYPLLSREGETLKEAGVNFQDLTMIFAANDEVIYADACCHVTPEGYGIIGTRIGQAIADYFNEPPQ
jgi:hypothetical protein